MTPGLKILIERMREHPEDFEPVYNQARIYSKSDTRWTDLVSIANGLAENQCLSDEEVAAWIEAKKRLMVDTFNAKVMDAVNYVPEQPVEYNEAMRIDSSGNLGIGTQLGRSMVATKNTIATGLFTSGYSSNPELQHGRPKL